MLSEAKHLCFFSRLLSNPEIDSFVSRVSLIQIHLLQCTSR